MSDQHSVDFLQKKYELPTEREVRNNVSKSGRYIAAFLAVTAVIGIFFSYRIAQVTHGDEADVGSLSLLSNLSSSFARLVGSDDKVLTGEEEDRINFLLMGIGGEGHDGPQLSDTMLFGSFQPSTSDLSMLSIPRDLYVPIPGYGNGKINHANAYGENQEKNGGLDLASQVVSTVLDQSIHYVIRIDFNGFSKIIDELGGIDVYVDQDFTDYQYPEYSGSPTYKTVTFTKGLTRMDGATALEFARSRHGNNGEGTDYARAARQQKMLLAVKDRALSLQVLLNPAKLTKLLDTLNSHIAMNLSFWEIVKLAKYIPDIDTNAVTMQVLDTTPGGPLYSTTVLPGPGFIILPHKDDWSDIQKIAADMLVNTATTADAGTATAAVPVTATVKIEIQNGTTVPGLASQTAQRLIGSNFDVVAIGNAADRTLATTTIFDLTDGRKAIELSALKQFLGADVVMSHEGWVYTKDVVPTELAATETPGSTLVTADESVDFLVIIGQDATSLVLK